MQLPEAHALDNAAADFGSGLDIRCLCRCVASPAVEKQAGVAAHLGNPKEKRRTAPACLSGGEKVRLRETVRLATIRCRAREKPRPGCLGQE